MTKDFFFFKFFLNVKIALLTNVVTAEIARKTSWTIFFSVFLFLQLNLILCKLWRYIQFLRVWILKRVLTLQQQRRGLLNFWAVFKKVSAFCYGLNSEKGLKDVVWNEAKKGRDKTEGDQKATENNDNATLTITRSRGFYYSSHRCGFW